MSHHGDAVAEVGFWNVTQGRAVDGDLAAGEFIEADKQIHDGGFASACWSNEGDHLAGFGFEVDAVEDGHLGIIGKRDIAVNDMALHARGGLFSAFVGFGFGVHDFEHSIPGRTA